MRKSALEDRPGYLDPKLSGLDRALWWLRSHDEDTSRLAILFDASPNHIRQLAYRGKPAGEEQAVHPWLTETLQDSPDPVKPGPTSLERERLGVRPHSETLRLGGQAKEGLTDLEERVENLSGELWEQMRGEKALATLRSFLAHGGKPGHHRFIRLWARVRHLIAETLLSSGRTTSALDQALRSLHLSRIAFQESDDPFDLDRVAKSALLASQAHLLRAEPGSSSFYLDLCKRACERVGTELGADYYRQRGVVAFQEQDDETALVHFERATEVLPDSIEPAHQSRNYEPRTFSERQLNLLTRDWDGALELVEYVTTRISVLALARP